MITIYILDKVKEIITLLEFEDKYMLLMVFKQENFVIVIMCTVRMYGFLKIYQYLYLSQNFASFLKALNVQSNIWKFLWSVYIFT